MRLRSRIALPLVLASLAATVPAGQSEEPLELRFGVYTTDKPTTVYKQFVDLLDHVQADIEKRLERETTIEIVIHKTYDEALLAFVRGEVDFVRFGPASYVLAQREQPKIELLAMELKKGARTFEGHIVARADSGIRELADLKGKTFAFGDPNSTIGRYLAQSELADAGILAADLSGHEFLGRHDLVARSVQLGDFDAGSVKASTFEKANTRGDLVVVHTFLNVTKPWIARAGLDEEVKRAIKRSLIELDDGSILDRFRVSSFGRARPKDYDGIRAAMEKAVERWSGEEETEGRAARADARRAL